MDRLARIAAHLAPPSRDAQVNNIQQQPTAAQGLPKVAVLGAAGGIGQPLSMLLKMMPNIGELSLYDVVGTPGVAADVSHMDTKPKVTSHLGPDQLPNALYNCHLVIIPAGVPRKPGMTRDDLFNINAGIVKTLSEGIAKYCPKAWVAIISNPVNSTVPIAAEVFKKAGTFNAAKLFGVTKLDVARANAFVGEILEVDPAQVNVPVIGGHAGVTILPLLSQAQPRIHLPDAKAKALMERIQNAGTEVVEAKAGKGSATLSMAYAAAKFAESCLKAIQGEPGVVECAYVSSHLTDLPFFASPLRLDQNGIAEFLPIGRMNELETANMAALMKELSGSIKKGVEFANEGAAKNDKSTAQPSSGSSIPSSKNETTGPLYAPSSSQQPKSGKKELKPQPSSGSDLPKRKEETTGGRY
ncbi:hypothetical protein ABBQ38_010412 [Trebouxia sp. C0009 RCD-2024]